HIAHNLSVYLFFYYSSLPLPHLHSFPTRRSSDLIISAKPLLAVTAIDQRIDESADVTARLPDARMHENSRVETLDVFPGANHRRSEEHTSELQSRFDLVCRLLLEKKKQEKKIIII